MMIVSSEKLQLTVGKYPNVNTLNKLVFPQAPSPMMTNFLEPDISM
jgi:hypothetical protein